MRHDGHLRIERRHHDHARRAELSGRGDNFPHRPVELVAYGLILRQDKSAESGTYRADFHFATPERLFQFADAPRQTRPIGLEADNPMIFHEVELLLQRLAGRNALLQRDFQFGPSFFRTAFGPAQQIERSDRRHRCTQQRCLQKLSSFHIIRFTWFIPTAALAREATRGSARPPRHRPPPASTAPDRPLRPAHTGPA